MSDRYSPKPGDTIANWNEPIGPYTCSESGPKYGATSEGAPDYKANWDEAVAPKVYTEGASINFGAVEGDNPGNYSLPPFANGQDMRKYSGGSNSNPVPGKTGAA